MSRAEVDRQIQERIAFAREAQEDGVWITYLIRDPRRPDLRGNVSGWPVYVGQTDDFGRRVRNHLRKSEKLARKGKGVKVRLKKLLHAGAVPNFEVLDRQPTRLQSLLSETNYARLCRVRGYDIANQTTLQNVAGQPLTIGELPSKWLWRFTLKQAAQDGIEVEFVCRACREAIRFPLSAFEKSPDPPKELRDIRDKQELLESECTFCGCNGSRNIRLRLTGSRSPAVPAAKA
jgi:hypothetical protein